MSIQEDRSSLASLHPAEPREMSFRHLRQGARLHGSHLMSLRHPSKTSEAARRYQPGDPARLVDWKAFGRTDQLLIREIRDEVSATVEVYLDISSTMYWPTAEICQSLHRQLPSKAEIAARVAFHLANIHQQMGDMVTIWLVRGLENLELQFKARSSTDLLSAYDYLESNGFLEESMRSAFSTMTPSQRRVDVVYWVGDCLNQGGVPADFLGQGKRACLIQTLSSLELDPSWMRDRECYFDESWHKREYLGRALKAQDNYMQQFTAWLSNIQQTVRNCGSSYFRADDSVNISSYLAFLEYFVSDFAES